MIDVILDTMIPEEKETGMPPASAIGFSSYAANTETNALADEFVRLIASISEEQEGLPFESLDEDRRLAIINTSRAKDIRLFSAFVTHVFRAYYTNQTVLERIGSGAVPPFPAGNAIPEDDWSNLEPVFERGPIFRPVEEA